MTTDDIFKRTRELAKTDYYQTLYSGAKELHFKIFENSDNLSDIQIQFLGYLGFYSSLFIDLALGDIDEIVFTDEIYENAYAYYRQHQRYEDMSTQSKDAKKSKQDTIQWVFKRPKKVK